MQGTNTGAVKGALHLHGAVLPGQRRGADLTLLFLPRQQLFTGGKSRFDVGRHDLLQTLHQFAELFHLAPRNPWGICLSGSEKAFTSRFDCAPLLARLICTLRASFCCH